MERKPLLSLVAQLKLYPKRDMLTPKSLSMGPKYAADHQKNVAKWISEGTFKAQQSVTVGIDNAIKGLLGMLKGDNFGKSVLTIEDLKVSSHFERSLH